MHTMHIRKTVLAVATMVMVGGGAAMAMQPHDPVDAGAMTALVANVQAQDNASATARPLPWYESGFTNRAQLQRQIVSEQGDWGDNG